MRHMTVEQLDADDVEWASIEEIQKEYAMRRLRCFACDSKELSDNGFKTLKSMSFCCLQCGEQFDAVQLAWQEK